MVKENTISNFPKVGHVGITLLEMIIKMKLILSDVVLINYLEIKKERQINKGIHYLRIVVNLWKIMNNSLELI